MNIEPVASTKIYNPPQKKKSLFFDILFFLEFDLNVQNEHDQFENETFV